MTPIVIAVLLLQGSLVATRKGNPVEVPPAMAPFFVTYMNCVGNRMKADPRMPAPSDVAAEVLRDARKSCADVRKSAAEQADEALARDPAHRDRAARQRLIEATLAAGDAANEALLSMPPPPPLSGPNHAPNR